LVKDEEVQEILLEKRLKFLFVGMKNYFMKELIDKSISHFFEFKEYIPHKEALQLMVDSSGLLILGSNSPQRLNRKVFEYTVLNKNIFYLGNVNSPTARIVQEYSGVISDIETKKDKIIEFLYNLTNEKVQINLKYSKEKLVEKLIAQL